MKKLIASLKQRWLKWKMDREIYNDIAPRLRGENAKPYPFASLPELLHKAKQLNAEALQTINAIEAQADGMGAADAAAFRYIMYRDLSSRLARYEAIMKERMLPTTCDPRLIATRA